MSNEQKISQRHTARLLQLSMASAIGILLSKMEMMNKILLTIKDHKMKEMFRICKRQIYIC
jgi:hypothetical protein